MGGKRLFLRLGLKVRLKVEQESYYKENFSFVGEKTTSLVMKMSPTLRKKLYERLGEGI